MIRKVLKVGNASLAVSLPSKWVKERGIRVGDEIEVEEEGKGLLIGAEKRAAHEEITVKAPSLDKFAKRIIITPYVQGYDTIHIHYNDPAVKAGIMEGVSLMTGFEVIDETRGKITIKNVSQGLELNPSSVRRRMFHLVTTIGETLLEALEKRDKNQLLEIESYELSVTKLHNLVRRMLNTQSNLDIKRVTSLYHITSEIEEISDQLYQISKYLQRKARLPTSIKGVKEVLALLKETASLAEKLTTEGIAKHRHETRRLNEWLEEEAGAGRAEPVLYTKLSAICNHAREITVELPYG